MSKFSKLGFFAALLITLNVQATPLDDSFTYQGQLLIGNAPANGQFDLSFDLFDTALGGAPVSTAVLLEDVSVTNGVFSVDLNFGSAAFNGDQLWLEIGVRPGGSVADYQTLSPRQEITSTPYALHAIRAESVEDIPNQYKVLLNSLVSDVDTLQTDVGTLQTDTATLQSQVSDLQTALALQQELNVKQQNKIVSLIRYIRDGNGRQDFQRMRTGLNNRLRVIRERRRWAQLGGILPPQMPALLLQNELNTAKDIAETLRCEIANLTQRPEDDCITTRGEVVLVDSYTVSDEIATEYETYSDSIEGITVDAQALVDAAIANGSPECTLWEADPENDVKLGFCLASVGVDTAETFTSVLSMMVQADTTTTVVEPYYIDTGCIPLVIEDGNTTCDDNSGNNESVGAWESITIEGETNEFSESGCTGVTSWDVINKSLTSACQ